MSNYTFVVHSHRVRERVAKWVRAFADPEDAVTVRLDFRRHLTIISRGVRASIRGHDFFRGTAICADQDAMVFSVDGWMAAPPAIRLESGEHSGVYVAASWQNGLTVDHDVFGAARLMHTAGHGFMAASDSLLVLADLRKTLGEPVTPDTEVFIARTALSQIAGQQISDETLFREISYVPGGRGLQLTARGWRLTGTPMAQRLARATDLDYRDTIRGAATDVARTVATLAEVRQWTPVLNLSGGYDSRLVFAGIVATNTESAYRVHIRNLGPESDRDIPVATGLAATFGVAHVSGGRPATAERGDELALWASSLMGVYDGYGPISTHPWHARAFSLSGIGAEIHKGNWGWVDLPRLAAKAAPAGPVRDALLAQLDKSARSLGIDSSAPNASEIYYLGYRNGIHGSSGHVGLHMTAAHPIMQLRLAELAHVRTGTGFLGSSSGISDCTILLAPEVAAFEYDEPSRDLSASHIEGRLRVLGGRLPTPRPYRVYGHPDDGPDGYSSLGIRIARAHGLTGCLDAESITARFSNALDLIEDVGMRAAYDEVEANAIWKLSKFNGALRASGVSPPRLSMLDLLRLAS